MIAAYRKDARASWASHLDVQRALQRGFRRAGVPLAFSQGFNPHPLISFSTALATGLCSDAEWFDVALSECMEPDAFLSRVNAVMPPDLSLVAAFEAPAGFGSLSACMVSAEYVVSVETSAPVARETLENALKTLLSGEIIVQKRTKGGIKPVDIRPQIHRVSVEQVEDGAFVLRVLGKLQADGGLRVEPFVSALLARLAAQGTSAVRRTAVYFDQDGLLPRQPAD